MAIATQIVVLNTTSAQAVTISESNKIPYEKLVSLTLQNLDGANAAYIGTLNVSSSSFGYYLSAGATLSLDLQSGDILYAIAAAGTPNIAVLAAEV